MLIIWSFSQAHKTKHRILDRGGQNDSTRTGGAGFSGGLDTTFCVVRLRELGYDPVCVTIDIGQNKDLTQSERSAKMLGVTDHRIVDGRSDFASLFVWPALKANALYQDVYPLATALSRPYIGKVLVDVANELDTQHIAHGCTGKGNDQVRIELTVRALMDQVNILDPVRDENISRNAEIAFLKERGIETDYSDERPYSVDQNMWGRSICAGILEDPATVPPEDIYEWTRSVDKCPDEPQEIEIGFQAGVPITLNKEEVEPVEMINQVNQLGGLHGIGRIDHIEDRLVGIKSREIYEAPAAMILIEAHRALERLTLTRASLDFKRIVEGEYAKLLYLGDWFSAHHLEILAYLKYNQVNVTGNVRLRLHKGSCLVVGRNADRSLYQRQLVTYGPESTFDQASAASFVKFLGMESQVQARTQRPLIGTDMHRLLGGNE